MQFIPVQIDATRFYHRAFCPLDAEPWTFSHSRQGVRAVVKWLREIAPDFVPVFSVSEADSFGLGLAGLILSVGGAVNISTPDSR